MGTFHGIINRVCQNVLIGVLMQNFVAGLEI